MTSAAFWPAPQDRQPVQGVTPKFQFVPNYNLSKLLNFHANIC